MPRRAIHGLFASALLVVSVAMSGVALAENRVAIVIGNGAYRHVPALKNPVNDANDMRAKLGELGFQLFGGADLDRPAMIAETLGRTYF